jgi:DNA repair protein RadD
VFALVALCRARALDVDFIVGETTQSKRIEILNKFKKRELMVLINHEILSTGVDVPNINKLILTRPVGSAILYSQMIGRALRGPKNGGNPVNTIVNIRDNLSQFPTAAFVYESFTNNFKI